MEWLGYVASVVVGIVLGVLGGGGSILTIPILVYLFHLDAVIASAYSLFIVGTTSLVGAIPKQRERLIDIPTGIYFGLPSILTIFVTRSWIVPQIPDVLGHAGDFVITKRIFILGLFAFLMILAAISMLLNRQQEKGSGPVRYSPLLIIEGVLIGFPTGLVGAGGGFLIIPALVMLTGLQFKTAVGTSLMIIGINSLAGFVGDVLNYRMDWTFLLGFTALAIIGILIGSKLALRIETAKLRLVFAVFVLAIGCWILISELYLIRR